MTPIIDSVPDLNRLVSDFERAWQDVGQADLAAFLPPRDHPHFNRIVCELVCIDLEMRWTRGTAKRLADYRRDFPKLFDDRDILQELAFEEYRQRIQAGIAVDPAEYQRQFGIEVSDWPRPQRSADRTMQVARLPNSFRKTVRPGQIDAANRVERTDDIPIQSAVDSIGFPKTMDLRAAIVAALRQSSPDEADKLDEAIHQLPKCGERIFGFELVEELGEGAFAKVFLARQLELADRPVALKVALSLNDEPRKLARLQHTNIVPIYSTHQNGAVTAVCMPFLGSLTLDQLFKNMSVTPGSLPTSGRELLSTLFDKHSATQEQRSRTQKGATESVLPSAATATPILDMMARYSHIEAVLWMGARIADGLAHAHERNILHLDLKPANILLTDDGQPMLLDFNLSIDLNAVDSVERARLGGTLPYMSPEQLDAFAGGKRDLDSRSDLYSLGVILYEMLTGSSPYPKRLGTMGEVVNALRTDRSSPPPPPDAWNPAITPAVVSIVQKLLKADRTERYQSAAEVREDLERQLADLPLRYAPDRSIPELTRKWCRRHPRWAVGALVAAAAIVLLIAPATAVAINQSRIAERKMQTETAEARLLWHDQDQEAKAVQVLLATSHDQERSRLEEGLTRGKAVLDRYGLGSDPHWMEKPLVARLTTEEQQRLRLEYGELLLFMVKAQQQLAGDETSKRTSLEWNVLAASVYPADQIAAWLVEQRKELFQKLPGEIVRIGLPERPEGQHTEFDDYHTGVKQAMEGRYREALRSLIPFSEAHPLHFQSWFVRGVCHEKIGEFHEAIACLTAGAALDPEKDHHLVYFNRGLARRRSGDFARAEDDFTRALKYKPNWPLALMERGNARKELGNLTGALEDFAAVVAQPDAPVRARFFLAEVEELAKKTDDAKRDREAAMKFEPKDEMDWSTRGYVRMGKEPEAALQDLDKAIAINPRSREALINKSVVLAEFLNRPREAVAVLDRFLEYYPDNTEIRLGRGVYLARIGECAKARADAERCLKYDRTPFSIYQAAGLYAQLMRHEKGSNARKEALALLATALQKGFSDFALMKSDTDLDPLRDDPEFKKLLEAAMGLSKKWD